MEDNQTLTSFLGQKKYALTKLNLLGKSIIITIKTIHETIRLFRECIGMAMKTGIVYIKSNLSHRPTLG